MRFSEAMILGSTLIHAVPEILYTTVPMVHFEPRFPFMRITFGGHGCALGMAEAAAGGESMQICAAMEVTGQWLF